MSQNLVVTTPQELQTLITDAVNVAVQQISFHQKIDPLPMPAFMPIEQASVFLNLAKPTIYSHVCNRTIPFIKKGKKLYFVQTELENWLIEGKKNKIFKNIKQKTKCL